VAVVQYMFTHKHKPNNTYNNAIIIGRVRAVPRLGELYPSIRLTTEGKVWKNLSRNQRLSKQII